MRLACKTSLCIALFLALVVSCLAGVLDVFQPAVGLWRADSDGGREVLKVDGSAWRKGQVAPQLQQSAVRIFGENAGTFIKSTRDAAYFPIAVASDVKDFQDGTLSVRFKPLAGRSDQAGGIFFGLHDDGNYYVLRANALESNLILFHYKFGQRYTLKEVKNAPAPTGAWSELTVTVQGTTVKGSLNGKLLLEYTIDRSASGKVGLWSKDDSVVVFEGFKASTAGK